MLRSLSPFVSRPVSCLCVLVLLGTLLWPAAGVLADDEGEPADDAAQTEDEGEPAPTADDGEGEAAAKPKDEQSLLEWTIEASGLWLIPLGLCSFWMVAIIVVNVMQVRRENMMPPELIEAFEQKLSAKDYQGAYETAKADDSFLARVLAAGLGKLNRGYEEAIEGMQEVGEEENMTLEHRLSMLALIGAIAPMLGLMGTVQGMIASFAVIAKGGGQPEPAELAKGVSTALFTTLEGLIIAIPAMFAFGLLRNRVARLVLEVGMVSEGLMSRFSTLGKGKSAGGAAPASAPAKPAE